jgi:hypothetical protein
VVAADIVCCASCGIDNVTLKFCDDCDLVKYCSDNCQEIHREQHEEECMKREAEIRDESLFAQPDGSCYGECPICCLPLPLDAKKFSINSCCCKRICTGCAYANFIRELDGGLEHKCPFCREMVPINDEEIIPNYMKRIKANDGIALCQMGNHRSNEGDFEGAFQYYTKAAALGDASSHHNLSLMYRDGEGVEKNEKKESYHLEEAAIKGHPYARFNLGAHERNSGRIHRASKHFAIAAKLGDNGEGFVSKEDYETALRRHQAAVDATKSEQREKVSKLMEARRTDTM